MIFKQTKILSIWILGVFFLTQPLSGQEYIQLFNNFRIYPSEVTQTEVFVTVSPVNENNLFASCNTLTFIPFFVSEGIYLSDNGGSSWNGSDSCNGQFIDFHGGDPGIAIDINERFVLTRLGRTPFTGLYSHFSYDRGQSWTSQTSISNDDLERASVSTDFFENSDYKGNTYASWVRFSNPFPIMFSKVSAENEIWTQPISVNSPSNRSAGGDIAVGSNGEVYICWSGVSEQSPFKELYVGFASSNNGGQSWKVNENAFPMNGITGLLTEKGNIRVNGLPNIAVDNSGGQRDGWIYLVTGQKNLPPAGSDPDIILNISTDGGNTWSDAIRVNQDQLNNNKVQYFPAVHVDRFGGLNILYYDDRNTTADSTGVFLSRSMDGGESWKEYEISDHNFNPEAIGGLGQGYQGDNIDLTSTSEMIIPVWMDNSSGNYQIWSANIRFEEIDGMQENTTSIGYNFEVYPVPSGGELSLMLDTQVGGQMIVTLVDLTGNISFQLLKKQIKPGKHIFPLNTGNLGLKDGIYILNINIGGKVGIKKVVLINH